MAKKKKPKKRARQKKKAGVVFIAPGDYWPT
jgi:hypothetical protein